MNTTIEINVSDYLNEIQIRNVILEEIRSVARNTATKEFQRIMDNAAYELVRREVDSVYDGAMADHIKTMAIKVIDGLSTYTVFKKPDAWDRGGSKAWDHLNDAMDECKPVISRRVNEIVEGMDLDYLHNLISDQIGVAIIEKLTRKEETK